MITKKYEPGQQCSKFTTFVKQAGADITNLLLHDMQDINCLAFALSAYFEIRVDIWDHIQDNATLVLCSSSVTEHNGICTISVRKSISDEITYELWWTNKELQHKNKKVSNIM